MYHYKSVLQHTCTELANYMCCNSLHKIDNDGYIISVLQHTCTGLAMMLCNTTCISMLQHSKDGMYYICAPTHLHRIGNDGMRMVHCR